METSPKALLHTPSSSNRHSGTNGVAPKRSLSPTQQAALDAKAAAEAKATSEPINRIIGAWARRAARCALSQGQNFLGGKKSTYRSS